VAAPRLAIVWPSHGPEAPRRAHRQRPGVRVGTAPDHAVELASQGVSILQAIWYPTALDRLPALRNSVQASPYGEELEERLRPLSAMAS
jgi:hypothetical protein